METLRTGLVSHLTFEEREKVERELGVMFADFYDSLHASWELFVELRAEVETILYGAPRGLSFRD